MRGLNLKVNGLLTAGTSRPIVLPIAIAFSFAFPTSAFGRDSERAFSRKDDEVETDRDVFRRGRGAPPSNSDSVAVPGLTLASVTYGGSGCPNGSVSAALSSDGREISILFDSYIARAGARAIAQCRLNLPFQVPPGYAVEIVKIDYRGFNSLPAGASARISSRFGFAKKRDRPDESEVRHHLVRASEFHGPVAENFILSSDSRGRQFSPCGEPFVLAAESIVEVTNPSSSEDAMSVIDSIDASAAPVKLSLRWRRCRTDRQSFRSDGRL